VLQAFTLGQQELEKWLELRLKILLQQKYLRTFRERTFLYTVLGKIPEKDQDLIRLVNQDNSHHVNLEEDSWRGMKKCCPINSGGLNPTLLKPLLN
jgi:ribulose 1,5-bisphosphate carboxylase large subunit-like protein